MAQIRPATTLARRMEKLIHDEIDESSGSQELRNAIFGSVLLGTGIIKGPLLLTKLYIDMLRMKMVQEVINQNK